jgi:hypothetical protein
MQFIEFAYFTKWVVENLSDEEYQKIQEELIKNPRKGDIIPHGHGLRKLRWRLKDKGKSGGVRIIYYLWLKNEELLMLYIYPKSEREDLTKEQLKFLAKMTKEHLR